MSRPRPPIGPALSGAVDLSALKQPPPTSGDSRGEGSAPTSAGIEVNETNFEREILLRSNQVPVVVLLWSPRSEVCLQLADILSGLAAADNGKWALASVNVDVSPRVAQIFGVEVVPTVVALAAGQPLSSFQGAQPPEQLRRWIDSLLSATAGKLSGAPDSDDEADEVDPALAQARQQLEDNDLGAALDSYQAILDEDPNHAEAKGAVRQIGFLMRATAHGPEAIAAADANPDDIEAAFAAADVQLLRQDASGAFDRLVALVRRTSGDQRTSVRTRLIELFELFDPADPDVIAGRRNLANALY
ncbi:thioredoxin family protein [Mycobacterium paraterrae]|uniref:Co-chaperone YbbN n=1 Tax=Mycobacterium paraterrae TaxID=577492 RepID=A0ABY3VSQ0_9MYCO|nr:co-chaperone YbbN [Mycobacterium paraterrae]UMB71092.1 co-chaperone YbbN [Mycobacterium paraterrae]